MYKFIIAVTAAAVLALPVSVDEVTEAILQAMQRLEDRIVALEAENERLRERIAELEDCCRLGAEAKAEDEDEEENPIAQLLRVEDVNPPGSGDMIAEALRLETRAAELEGEVRELEREATELKVRPVPLSVRSQGDRAIRQWNRSEQDRVRHQGEQLRNQAVRVRGEARQQRGRADRLRREAAERWQILYAWNGSGMVILETRRDWSNRLGEIGADGFLTWTGRLVEFTEDGARYEVNIIRPAQEPADFNKYKR
jgi:hypothetical protein